MNEAQISYVIEQLEAGVTKSDLRAALEGAGYTSEQIEELFATAEERTAPAPPPPSAEPASATREHLVADEPHGTVQESRGSGKKALVIGLLITIVLLTAGVGYAFWSGLVPVPAFVSRLLGQPPYQEDRIMAEMQRGFAKVNAAHYTVAVQATSAELDSDTYLMPEELADELGDPSLVVGFLPSDFTLRGELSGNFDIENSGATDSYGQVVGSYETADFSVNVDVEGILARDEGAFLRINRMPSFFFFDFTEIKGEWIHLIEEPLTEYFEERISEGLNEENQEAFERVQKIAVLADAHQVFRVESVEEDVVLNETAYKYTLVLNQATLRDFLEAVVEELQAMDSDFEFDEEEFNEQIDVVTSEAFVEYANTHAKLVVWANRSGIPVQFGIENRIPVDDDAVAAAMSGRSEYMFESLITDFRDDASDYETENDGFADYCDYVLDNSFYAFRLTDEDYVCVDGAEQFAVSFNFSDGVQCTDSTGYFDDGTVDREAVACVALPEDDTPPPQADRQINTTITMTLDKINEPQSIEIPENALSLEEASERMPILGMYTDSITRAQVRGADASLQSQLNNLRAEAELFYGDNDFSYAGLCADVALDEGYDGLYEAGFTCNDSATAYAAMVELSENQYCVDSTGVAKRTRADLEEATACPSP